MTAFDTAWLLLKMPIVPGSLRYDKNAQPRRFDADFEDPITGDIMPMTATHNAANMDDADFMSVEINHPDPEMARLLDSLGRLTVSDAPMSIHTTGENRKKGDVFWPYSSFVQNDFRRRGYATAMYDMIAAILDRHKGKQLHPSNSLSDEATALWANKTKSTYPFGSWPVRDDL